MFHALIGSIRHGYPLFYLDDFGSRAFDELVAIMRKAGMDGPEVVQARGLLQRGVYEDDDMRQGLHEGSLKSVIEMARLRGRTPAEAAGRVVTSLLGATRIEIMVFKERLSHSSVSEHILIAPSDGAGSYQGFLDSSMAPVAKAHAYDIEQDRLAGDLVAARELYEVLCRLAPHVPGATLHEVPLTQPTEIEQILVARALRPRTEVRRAPADYWTAVMG